MAGVRPQGERPSLAALDVDWLVDDAEVPSANGQDHGRDPTLPPHSEQAERAIIGSVLKAPWTISAATEYLTPADFQSVRHRHIFAAMQGLESDGKPVDFHSLADRLQQDGTYDLVGGLLYVSQINLETPSAANIEYYAKIVERTALMRKMIHAAQCISEIGYRDNLDADVALSKAEALIQGISSRRRSTGFRKLEDVLDTYADQVRDMENGEAVKYGIPTGFLDLDKLLGGFKRTDLILIGARTSIGKTSFAMNLATNASLKYGAKVAIFSLEMDAEQLAARLLSMESGVPTTEMRTGVGAVGLNEQQARMLDRAMNVLAGLPMWIDDTGKLSISELSARARRLDQAEGIDMIVVDYIGLVGGTGGREQLRVQELGEVSKKLKALAKELNVPVVALCQLSRAVEQRASNTPMLSDLRESGDLEQDADVVLFIHREEKVNPDTDKKGVADITVAKHRNGPTGACQLLFLDRTTRFLDYEICRP